MSSRSHGKPVRPSDFTASFLAQTGLILAAAGAPLAFFVRMTDPYGLPKLAVLAAGACLAMTARLADAWHGRPGVRRTPVDGPLLASAAAILITAFFSQSGTLSLFGQPRYLFYAVLPMMILLVLFYAAAWPAQREDTRARLRALAAAGAIVGLYGVMQAMGCEPFSGVLAARPGERVFSSLGGPVYLGSFLVLCCPLALHLARMPNVLDRRLGIGASAMLWPCLVLSGSRGAWIGAAVGCAAYLVLADTPASGGRKRTRRTGAWVLAAAAVLGGVMLLGLLWSHRLSDLERLQVWTSGARIFARHPWLGTGPDTFGQAFREYRTERYVRAIGWRHGQVNAHNELIEIAATMGLVGLAAYLWLLWSLWCALARALRDHGRRRSAAAVSGALAGLFVVAKLNPLSLASLAPAVILLGGMLASQGTLACGKTRWVWAALLWIAAGWGVRTTVRNCRADHLQWQAQSARAASRYPTALSAYREAYAINPGDPEHVLEYTRFLMYKLAVSEGEPERKARYREEAVAVSRAWVRRHPRDAAAHHSLGTALWVCDTCGGEDRREQAARILDRAQELDRYSLSLYSDRLKIAVAMGDREKSGRLTERIAELRRVQRKSGSRILRGRRPGRP